ncbi:MAG: DUF58 domain-containing protein [Gammaproteobacteria bacterium]
MLSSRALLFAGLVVLVGVVATWLDTPALALFWRLGLIALIVAAVADSVLASRIRVRGSVDERAPLPLGREVPLTMDLHVLPARPTMLEIRTALAPQLRVPDAVQSLAHPGTGSLQLKLAVRAVALGELDGLSLPARVLGPLGLAWWRHPVPVDVVFRVVPDPAIHAGSQRSAVESGVRQGADVGYGIEVRQLRPYRPGDPRRAVDWKASARSGSLVTRDVVAEHRQEVMLFIDAGRGSRTEIDSLPRLGHYVNLASSLIQAAARTDDHVGLLAFAGQPLVIRAPMRAATAAPGLQRDLGRLAAQAVESNPLLAMLRLQSVVRHRTLVVVMADLDDPAVATQLTSALRLLARRHLPLVVDFDSAELAALEGAAPATWADPYVALAAQEFRQGQRANALRLTRLGCQVLLARPEAAQRELARAYQAIRVQRRL